MTIIKGIESVSPSERGRVAAIGIFDGLHLGHKAIISRASSQATANNLESVIVTFEPHPESLFSANPPKILTPFAKKAELIEALKVDLFVVIEFDEAFSRLSPEDFCEKIVSKKLSAIKVIVGENFRFGSGAKGDTDDLDHFGKIMGFESEVVPMVKDSLGHPISSSRIRSEIEEGRLETAEAMLGRPYSLKGKVVQGSGRGIKMGFPTANLMVYREVAAPKEGVYEVKVSVNGETVPGVANLGEAPTFGEKEKRLEVHLFNRKEDLYGTEVEVFFIKRIRGQMKFSSQRELAERIAEDVAIAKKSFAG